MKTQACLQVAAGRVRDGVVLLLILLLGACSHLIPPDAGQGGRQVSILPGPAPVASEIAPYRLAVGDRLEIKFFYTPELNESLAIRPDGRLSLQLVGDVQAAGFTVEELRHRLRELYSGTLKDPELAVIVKQYTPPFVYVGGEVRKPGRVLLGARRMTALEAVLEAGDFNRGAERRNVVLMRNVNGKTTVMTLNLRDYIASRPDTPVVARTTQCTPIPCPRQERAFAGNPASDVVLQPQDIVYVPEAQISQLAMFFSEYLNKILPIYGNMGLVFSYDINSRVKIQSP